MNTRGVRHGSVVWIVKMWVKRNWNLVKTTWCSMVTVLIVLSAGNGDSVRNNLMA